MSIADLLAQATPQAQYYDYDRKIMEDYDNRAKIYSDAFDKYQKDFADYQTKVDDFNLMVDQYNKNLADPTFTGSAPVFKGGAEPTAPADPSFSQGDIDAFIDEATARATRRGQTAATAFNIFQQGGNFATAPQVQGGAGVSTQPEFSFSGSGFADGGAVVPPPDDPPVLAPARNEGALGLGYYIPPGFREFGRKLKPLAEALNLPYNLVAGTGRKTRDALDSSLPIEERIRKGGEAAVETGIQAILPFFGRFAGQPLSRAVVESFFPVSTPKSAAEAAVDTVENMGRRNMLKGAAAATGVAALLPEAFIEATSKVPAAVTKTAAKAAVINPINMAAENIRLLKKQIDEADELRDEIIEQVGEGAEASAQQSTIYNTQDEIFDVVRDTLEEFEPEDYVQASDEALEELAKYNYDLGNLYGGVNYYSIDTSNFKNLANEAKRRGLHKLKNEKGITKFPNISALVEELDEKAFEQLQNLTLPNTALKMTDDSGKSTEQLIKELGERAFKSQYDFVKRQLEMETDLSPEEIDRIARINASRKGRNMAEGGVVSFAPYLR